jgi:hypothetical protein
LTIAATPSPVLDQKVLARVVAGVVAASGLVLLLTESHVRVFEARVSSFFMSVTHIAQSRPMGSSVIFAQGQHWIGYSITAGCTATLLAVPFFFISSGLLLTRRVSITRGLVGLAVVVVFVAMVNQLRLLLIGGSMQLWGFTTGYNRSHVLAGGVLSTFGVAIGIAVFLALAVRQRGPARKILGDSTNGVTK